MNAAPPQSTRRFGPVHVIVAILVVVVAVLAWRLLKEGWNANDSSAVRALNERAKTLDEPTKGTAQLVVSSFDEYRNITRMWSGVYNGCVLGAAALGLIAALVLKLESFREYEAQKKDVAAILASAGAVLAALSTSGDFQTKWQTNRSAAAEVESLAFDMLSPSPLNNHAIYEKLKRIAEERHFRLVGAKADKVDDGAGADAKH